MTPQEDYEMIAYAHHIAMMEILQALRMAQSELKSADATAKIEATLKQIEDTFAFIKKELKYEI